MGVGGTGTGPAGEGVCADAATVGSSFLAGCAAISGATTIPGAIAGTGWSSPADPDAAAGTASTAAGVSVTSAGCGSVIGACSSVCMIAPPAPNSIILIAHSLHATRWRHGRRTTSRGELRHTIHSDDGSSSTGVGAEGGYVCSVGLAAGTMCWTEAEESP
jgi:hypothetical protein